MWVHAVGHGGWRPRVPPPDDLVPAVGAGTLAEATAEIGAAAVRWSTVVAWDMTRDAFAHVPEVDDGATAFAEACASTQAQVLNQLRSARRGRPADARLPLESLAFVERAVARDVKLAPLLRSYQRCHEFWAEALLAEITGALDGDERIDALRACSADLLAYIGAVTDEMLDVYERTRRRHDGTRATRVAQTVRAVLSGAPVEVAQATEVLGHDLAGWHVGCVLTVPAGPGGPAGPAAELLDAAIARLGALTGVRVLALPGGPGTTWAWLPVAGLELDGPLVPGVRIAMGEAAAGVEGFRRTHEEAREAERVAGLMAAAPSVVVHGTVAHLALLTRDAESARRFVERELRPLADAPELRATVLAYLRHECSIGATAHAVGVHRNTVRERLLRVEELLGRHVSSGEIALRLALELEGLVGGPGATPGWRRRGRTSAAS